MTIKARLLLIAGMLIFAGTVGASTQGAFYDSGTSYVPLSGGTLTGAVNMGGYSVYDAPWLYRTARTSDAAAYTETVHAGDAYWAATGGSQTGANLVLGSGTGSRFLTVSAHANGAGDTITITVNGTATTWTEGAGTFDIDGQATDAAAACAIYTYGIANPVSGVTVARSNATCSDAKVGFIPTAGTAVNLTVALGAAGAGDFGSVTSGANGQVLLGNLGSSTAPSLSWSLDPDTGFYDTANLIVMVAAGNVVAAFQAGSWNTYSNRVYSSTQVLPLGGASAACTGGASGDVCVGGKYFNLVTATTLAAAATTFAATTNVVSLTGDGGGNTVATITGGIAGQELTLLFMDDKVTITDTDAATANTINTSAAFTSSANDTMRLMSNGTKWYELSRSVN